MTTSYGYILLSFVRNTLNKSHRATAIVVAPETKKKKASEVALQKNEYIYSIYICAYI